MFCQLCNPERRQAALLSKSWSFHVSWRTSVNRTNTSRLSPLCRRRQHLFGLGMCRPHQPRLPWLGPWEGCRGPPWPVSSSQHSGNGGHATPSQQAARVQWRVCAECRLLWLVSIFGEKTVLSPTSEASICCTNSMLKYA